MPQSWNSPGLQERHQDHYEQRKVPLQQSSLRTSVAETVSLQTDSKKENPWSKTFEGKKKEIMVPPNLQQSSWSLISHWDFNSLLTPASQQQNATDAFNLSQVSGVRTRPFLYVRILKQTLVTLVTYRSNKDALSLTDVTLNYTVYQDIYNSLSSHWAKTIGYLFSTHFNMVLTSSNHKQESGITL